MSCFAGIDGGQTATQAVIGDENGRILGRGAAGPADEVGEAAGSTRLSDALQGALENARLHARLPGDVRYDAVVAGISGYDGTVRGRAPELPAARCRLVHDALAAHAGALNGKPGIVAIAGTGSVVYATDERGKAHEFGGWGYLFGDEGSAFWIVRETLCALMRAEDERDASAVAQVRDACEYFGKGSLREIARAFYSGDVSRHRIASFARDAIHAGRVREIAERGVDRLAALVRRAIALGAHPVVSCVGGVFSDPGLTERFASAVRSAGVRLVEPAHDPAVGALLLAYREAGVAVEVRA